MRYRMDIKDYYGNHFTEEREFKSEDDYDNHVKDRMQKHGEKVTGERRVDPEGMYLAFKQQYHTVSNLARAYGISEDYALEQINKGKSINQQSELLNALIEATSLFDNYPETHEAIGTHEVINEAIKQVIPTWEYLPIKSK